MTIGSGVTTIGVAAFGGSNSLSSVTFVPGAAGNTVAIGDLAFDPNADTLAYGAGSTRLFEGNTEIEAGTALDKLNDKTLTWKSTGYTVTYVANNGTNEKAVENDREAGDYIRQSMTFLNIVSLLLIYASPFQLNKLHNRIQHL